MLCLKQCFGFAGHEYDEAKEFLLSGNLALRTGIVDGYC